MSPKKAKPDSLCKDDGRHQSLIYIGPKHSVRISGTHEQAMNIDLESHFAEIKFYLFLQITHFSALGRTLEREREFSKSFLGF